MRNKGCQLWNGLWTTSSELVTSTESERSAREWYLNCAVRGRNRDWAMGSTWAGLVGGRENLVKIKHVKGESTYSTYTQKWHQSEVCGTACMTGALSWVDKLFNKARKGRTAGVRHLKEQQEHKKLFNRTDNRLANSLWVSIKENDCMDNITIKVCYKSPHRGKKADEDYFSSSRKFPKMTETGYYFSVTSTRRATQQEVSERFQGKTALNHHSILSEIAFKEKNIRTCHGWDQQQPWLQRPWSSDV